MPKFSSILAIEKNLEIIIGDDLVIYAYRFDHPADMIFMVRDDGKWMLTEEAEMLDSCDMLRLEL